MKQEDIKKLSENDLKDKIKEYTDNLEKMKFTHSVSGLENPLSIRSVRRDIARLNTALNIIIKK